MSAAAAETQLAAAAQVLRAEGEALLALAGQLGPDFLKAIDVIMGIKGRVVVSGMGKAGLIGRKITATLASTGTPSLFLHPAEALHGDLGMLTMDDALLALSNSGETEEITRLLPHVVRRLPVLAMTRSKNTTLGRQSDVTIELGPLTEACPLGLAPSVSTTAMLALGDAIAFTLERLRGFSDRDFARMHPSGSLGQRFKEVGELMRTGPRCPIVEPTVSVFEAVNAITSARAGSAIVADPDGTLRGIFTDGDFRRRWAADPEVGKKPVASVMTAPCLSARVDELAATARSIMLERHIDELPVIDRNGRVVGLLDLQDLSF